MKNNQEMQTLSLRRMLRIGLIGAAIAGFAAGGATAQQSAPGGDKSAAAAAPGEALDEIVVTGSLIRTPSSAAVGSAVIAVDQKDQQATGANNVSEMLRDIPQVSNLGVSEASRA